MAALLSFGVSHRNAPVGLRERVAFPPAAAREALARLARGEFPACAGLAEAALLSTCNRMEVYLVPRSGEEPVEALVACALEFLRAARDVEPRDLRPHGVALADREAVEHLCRVASGLESMVLGEFQILGQVSAACDLAREAGTLGPHLEEAFRAAIRSGRRARAETEIARHPQSVPSEAVRLIEEAQGPLEGCRILVVGSGEVARAAGLVLRKRGARTLLFVSRIEAHARDLALSLEAEVLPWERLPEALGWAEVALFSTSAPEPVVTAERLGRSGIGREGRPLLLVDLGVPRNVEPAAGALPGVRLIDIDQLQGSVDHHLAARLDEVPRVERILAEEIARFEEWRREGELRPFFADVRRRIDAIRKRELDRALGDLGDLPPRARERIAHFSEALVRHILHAPTRRMRAEGDRTRSALYLRVARELLELPAGGEG
jgi:glutamyl-tRNA reductase